MRKEDIKLGDKVTIPAVVESLGHDDAHIIVRVAGTPVQIWAGAVQPAPETPRHQDIRAGGLAMADKLTTRGYENERDRYRNNARRALELAQRRVESALAQIDRGPSSLIVADSRHASELTAEAYASALAYMALYGVRFLTEPEAKD